MELGSPILALHNALSAAIYRDLPDIHYEDRDWDVWNTWSPERIKQSMKDNIKMPTIKKTRRPDERDIEIVLFAQTWGSTSLGYGGMGCSAMTPAYTVVVQTPSTSCVYFGGGELAYKIDHATQSPEGRQRFFGDLHSHSMTSVSSSRVYL